jgi:hypothetical protein
VAPRRRDLCPCGRRSGSPLFQSAGQIGEVVTVEANGGAEVDGSQLAALDEALDGPRMDVQ